MRSNDGRSHATALNFATAAEALSKCNVLITLVTRKNCHLCEDALSALRALGVEPELRDVDADNALYALYDWRVPVVTVDGRVVAEGRIDQEALRKALVLP